MQKLRNFCLVFWQVKKTTSDGQILKLENCYAKHTLLLLSITETFSINRIEKTTEAALRQSSREVKVSNVLITSLALPQQLVWRHTPQHQVSHVGLEYNSQLTKLLIIIKIIHLSREKF